MSKTLIVPDYILAQREAKKKAEAEAKKKAEEEAKKNLNKLFK